MGYHPIGVNLLFSTLFVSRIVAFDKLVKNLGGGGIVMEHPV